MHTNTRKSRENKKRSAADAISQLQHEEKPSFPLVHTKPGTIAQLRFQEIVNNSSKLKQLNGIQEMARFSPHAEQTAQLQLMANNYTARQQQPILNKVNQNGLPVKPKTGMGELADPSAKKITNQTLQRVLMTEAEFIKASDSKFSGKRNRVTKVDEALKKCKGASSKSVALTELIGACNEYLQIVQKKDKTRIAGVKKLLKNATEELAAWRLRERMPLPASVYRMDERGPDEIAKVGFQPWHGAGNISMVEHVTQALRVQRPNAPTGESGEVGMGAKKHSQYVSTSGNLNFAKDPTLLQGLLNKKFYKIDTQVDPNTFTDVNKHFDELGEPNPYEPQFEFIKSGGIPGNQVTQYVEGRALMDFVIAGTDASTWNISWVAMPVVPVI